MYFMISTHILYRIIPDQAIKSSISWLWHTVHPWMLTVFISPDLKHTVANLFEYMQACLYIDWGYSITLYKVYTLDTTQSSARKKAFMCFYLRDSYYIANDLALSHSSYAVARLYTYYWWSSIFCALLIKWQHPIIRHVRIPKNLAKFFCYLSEAVLFSASYLNDTICYGHQTCTKLSAKRVLYSSMLSVGVVTTSGIAGVPEIYKLH